ncbi:MAG: magnesium transporter CorA family protein [Cellulosilyticaceae bacterium]
MKYIYKTVGDSLKQLDHYEEGSWIQLISPTPEEITEITTQFNIESNHIISALDEEERAHIDTEDNYTLIIVDVPIKDENGGYNGYGTIPLEIILGDKFIITVCTKELQLLQDFSCSRVRGFYTFKKTRFILQLLYKNASYYLQYLRFIDKTSNRIEQELHKSMKNKELIQLLELEKSLVYFTTSLRANEMVLEKMMRMETIKQYPEDRELLEDVIIENKQAIEMANIYSSILSGMMDAFASVISNNLNIVMKTLTSITIVMSIPTMVFSFYGMNVALPLQDSPFAYIFILVVSIVIIAILSITMIRKKLF